MRRDPTCRLAIAGVWLIAATAVTYGNSDTPTTHAQLLSGDRVLLGTVDEIRSDQARIDTGEVQPRFVPMGVRKSKGLPDLKKGDRVELTLNDQNLLVDVHLTDESSHHRVVHGQIAEPLDTGHDEAVLRTNRGKEESYGIRPVARSKVASVPVGLDAVFLIDEMDRIVDVTYGSKEAVHRAAELWQKKSPLKGNFDKISGVIVNPLEQNTVVIRTEDGKEQQFEVRPFVQHRLKGLVKGDAIVLLVDEENQVGDIAVPPKSSLSKPRG
ncbi:MAG TPA: hypothetical protein VJR03_04850 [Nitrospira sp.]|nr:hypothetical protein [Nitrospira sp.]